ncbi:MAG: ParB/RepB/Spo0J family partition protein [Actinobacteria bacterium]|nr:ParB/RepB/Spo0J family partition protein [Actinomycetota bacterium]MCL5445781.1 ParB/RepB/Spo0J family partition protein [Actinomycetota bacterium]
MARRSGLGKGLGALIPNEVVGDSTSSLLEVPITSIRPNVLQPRRHFDEESMATLAASIRELGVLQPVLVRKIDGVDADYELIAGERRWRAARRAGFQTVPVLVQTGTTDPHSLEQALVENIHREGLNGMEEAAGYQQLIDDFGYTHDQIATRVGKSRAAVTNTLRLLQLPAGAQRAVAEGSISAGHARAILGTPDRVLQESLVSRIISDGLTVRAVEEIVRDSQATGEPSAESTETGSSEGITNGTTERSRLGPRLPEPGVLELEELLASHLDTSVKVEMSNKKGRLIVSFATLEDLERIYRVILEGRTRSSAVEAPA